MAKLSPPPAPHAACVVPLEFFNVPPPELTAWNVPLTILPPVTLPETLKLLNVPTEVMFGCAFVYTVPATSALAT